MDERIAFRDHALQQMHTRRISVAQVRQLLETGTEIESYPDRWPFPARLLVAGRPLHVVVADDAPRRQRVIVTVYDPSEDEEDRWDTTFSRRLR